MDLIPACHLARGGVHPEQVTTLHRRQLTTQLLSPKLDYLEGINAGTQREGKHSDTGIELQPFSLQGDGAKSLQQRAALGVNGVGLLLLLSPKRHRKDIKACTWRTH